MILLPYRDHTYFRLISTRTGEALFEVKMLFGSIIVWGGHYRPCELAHVSATMARLSPGWARSASVSDPSLTFGDCLDAHAACPRFGCRLVYDPRWNGGTMWLWRGIGGPEHYRYTSGRTEDPT